MDTYVLATDVLFPTDLNLLRDAGRKCVDLILQYRDQSGFACGCGIGGIQLCCQRPTAVAAQ
jgi:hypothetical protein